MSLFTLCPSRKFKLGVGWEERGGKKKGFTALKRGNRGLDRKLKVYRRVLTSSKRSQIRCHDEIGNNMSRNVKGTCGTGRAIVFCTLNVFSARVLQYNVAKRIQLEENGPYCYRN